MCRCSPVIHIINHSSGVNICPKKSETACHWFLGYFETICVGDPGFKTVLSTHVNWNLLNFFSNNASGYYQTKTCISNIKWDVCELVSHAKICFRHHPMGPVWYDGILTQLTLHCNWAFFLFLSVTSNFLKLSIKNEKQRSCLSQFGNCMWWLFIHPCHN